MPQQLNLNRYHMSQFGFGLMNYFSKDYPAYFYATYCFSQMQTIYAIT